MAFPILGSGKPSVLLRPDGWRSTEGPMSIAGLVRISPRWQRHAYLPQQGQKIVDGPPLHELAVLDAPQLVGVPVNRVAGRGHVEKRANVPAGEPNPGEHLVTGT